MNASKERNTTMQKELSPLQPELDAIATIDKLLAELPDYESKARVLEFCQCRIQRPTFGFGRRTPVMLTPPEDD